MNKKLLLFLASFIVAGIPFSAQTTFSCTAAGTVCPCGGYGASTAEYYAGYFNDVQTYFTSNSPGLTRNDPTIDFTADNSWGNIVPPASGSNSSPDTYSTRWSGRIFLATGTYTFWLTSDDGSWFWLGGSALAANPTSASAFINDGGLHSAATVSAVAVFTADCLQDFKVHFGENTGQNRCNLEYGSTGLGITRKAVPATAYCPCMSNAILPIELKDFYATPNKDDVTLYWNTASEKNNMLFTVFKSTDGMSWTELGTRSGAGTINTERSYSLVDKHPVFGLNYYYLQQTDNDGATKKFKTLVVDFSNADSYIQLYPNPFHDKFSISASTEWKDGDRVEVYNSLGKPVDVPIGKAGNYVFEINTADLPKGNYTVKVYTQFKVIVKKMMKQ